MYFDYNIKCKGKRISVWFWFTYLFCWEWVSLYSCAWSRTLWIKQTNLNSDLPVSQVLECNHTSPFYAWGRHFSGVCSMNPNSIHVGYHSHDLISPWRTSLLITIPFILRQTVLTWLHSLVWNSTAKVTFLFLPRQLGLQSS